MKPLSNFPDTIKTMRLELRVVPQTDENAKMIFNIIEKNRDYLEAWQGHFVYLNSVDAVYKELGFRYAEKAQNKGVLFGIYKDNKFIGRICFFDVNMFHKDCKSCKIGYWLIKSENGKGFMSEALYALSTQLFKFGFDKIILEIDAGNILSESVAKRNGYILEKRNPMDSWAKCVGKRDSLIFSKSRERE